MKKRVRFKKLRLWAVYPLLIVYFLFARITDFSFTTGALLVLLGTGLRFWASGFISKSRTLAASGPYAYTRNPLYLGNFIIGFGMIVISGNIWLIPYYLVSFYILYRGTIQEEQEGLEKKFADSYRRYLARVPMFLPAFRAFHGQERKAFSLEQSFKNGEYIRMCGFLLSILFFYFWKAFWVQKQGLTLLNKAALVLFVVFFALLCFNIYIRRKSERRGTDAKDRENHTVSRSFFGRRIHSG
jgi:protein-S-isoprenylcysteine O-methyltransferase Ste14